MAATLTDTGELTFASFPIEKMETDENGDLIIFGKISDAGLDSDQQIVDPSWMSGAAKRWLSTGGNLRVNHNPQRDPAGIGLEVSTDEGGATWARGLVVEPVAKQLVSKRVLRSFSVGIARPTIQRDMAAKGGRITDGELVEVSLVDRPANARCTFQLVKSAGDGTPEYVGEVFGAEADIAKALDADLTKAAAPDGDDLVNVDLPPGASISISPKDFAKLHTLKQRLVTKTAAVADKRDVNTAERRSLASEGNALPDGSYPIDSTGDLQNAAVLARSGHGDTAAARRLIARRAEELGVANPLDEGDSANKSISDEVVSVHEGPAGVQVDAYGAAVQKADAPAEAEAATPDVTRDPEAPPQAKKAKKPKKGKKLPPWLNKPADGDADDSCKQDHAHTEKCKTTPAEAAGLSGTHDMSCAPVPDLLESPPMASTKGSPTPQSASGAGEAPAMAPVPAHREPDGAIVEPFENDAALPADGQGETPTALEAGMMKSSPEVAAILRFKAAGIDIELGRLHDLTCPAYHPEDTAKCHPFADLRHTDEGYFQRKAVEAACGPSMDLAKSLHLAWQAARVLREASPADLNQYRLDAHKAFRDANPGPTSAPSPGMMTPGRYNRPPVTDGHSALSPAHDGPNTSPQVATSAPSAHGFDRPPLAAGHQSPSPSHMKASFEYPDATGVPTRLNYAIMEKERARNALIQMHEHLSRQFPQACPMALDAPLVQPESLGVPPTAGIGKGAEGVTWSEGVTYQGEPAPVAASLKADPEDAGQFADADVYKGFKKARKKLGKKVLSGSMTVDEARARLGRQFAQKGDGEPPETVQKATVPAAYPKEAFYEQKAGTGIWEGVPAQAAAPPLVAAIDPEVVKAAVAEATSELKDLLVKQQDTFTAKLAEQQKVIDAIADQPDPSTAAFSGLAFNPLHTNKAARPAGVATQAEIAERTQNMVMRTLQNKYNSSSDPTEREAYYSTLARMRGYTEP